MPRSRFSLAGVVPRVALCACVATCATGNTDSRPAKPVERTALGRIGFITGPDDPEYAFDSLLHGKGHGAGVGALEGVGACFEALVGNAAGGDALFVLAFLAVCAPIGAVVGTVAGATQAAPAISIEELQEEARPGIKSLRLNETALEAGIEYGRSVGLDLVQLDPADPGTHPSAAGYARFAGSVDFVIELDVTDVSATTSGRRDLSTWFALEGRVRVIAVPFGDVLDDYEVSYRGEVRGADEWLAGNGVAVQDELRRGVRSLAVQALDAPLLYRPVARGESRGGWTERVPGYALRPIDPPVRIDAGPANPWKQLVCGEKYEGGPTYGLLERFPLESRMPTLRWEALPRDFDLETGSGPGQAHELRYDLRILEGAGIVYERLGLTEPSHTLEEPLPACGEFRWTVRARFRLDGLARASEWTGAYNTIGGYVDPAWIRGHPGAPALAAIPSDETIFYPIIRSPSADGEDCECR